MPTKEYDVCFDEDSGINIGLKQRGGEVKSGRVQDAMGHVVGGGGDGRGEGEQTVVFEVPVELQSQVKKDSVLLAVNNMPVRGGGGGCCPTHTAEVGLVGVCSHSSALRIV